ncbi:MULTISPECIES: alpha/beta hydrolase [unclassified Haladaptatus]|uniref:alpha/beta hydrolase n=1 Tax=unclassified Haladaptatus TaxID=2622732 RepID=UPI0023E77F5C|nr:MULTISPECIES: dienelactone hydrolase family protein [unclassified Haladaptatus]
MSTTDEHPHQGQHVSRGGTPLEEAEAAVILLHGRGAMATGILALGDQLAVDGVAYLAPQAANNTWYPYSFMNHISTNEPHLSSALELVADLLAEIEEAGIPAENTALVGFSQGGCLATEYIARNAKRYGGVAGLSAGLIGPRGTPRNYEGDLEETPVFLGCSDSDPHIPLDRVQETTKVLSELGAEVDERIYRGMGHTVNDDEIDAVRELVSGLVD